MTKKLKIVIDENIDNCGECIHDWKDRCEITDTPIANHWDGVLDNCPLEDIVE